MHKVTIPQSVIDDVVRSRGREHVFDTLDPAKTALIVVDMQNGFMMKGVAHALCEEAIEIVPNINRLADALRRTGGAVVWIQTAATPETLQSWSVNVEMNGPERTAHRFASLGPGTKGYELWADLDVQARRSQDSEDPLLRLHPGLLESGSRAARPRHRHGDHHRHRHQCVLRIRPRATP